MARSKKWWAVHVSAGVATALLILFGVTKCSGEKDERSAKEAAQADLLNASQHIESVAAHVDSLVVVNREQQDSIRVLNDSIVVLNDSLVRVNGELVDVRGRLADCEKAGKGGKPASKPCPCEKQEKPVVKKPAAPKKKTQPKAQPKLVTVVEQKKEQPAPVAKPCQPSRPVNVATETEIEISGKSHNPGNIVVANPEQVGGKTTVKITDGSSNAGTIVVSNGGTVNITTGAGNANANANANATAGKTGCPAKQNVDTAVQQVQQQKRAAAAFVYVKRVTYTK